MRFFVLFAVVLSLALATVDDMVFVEKEGMIECHGNCVGGNCFLCEKALRVIYDVASVAGCTLACAVTGPYIVACEAACNALLQGGCGSDCPKIACEFYHFC
ncbi:hypothetical protein RCL1_002105 [Eukaryota sp. TZLM3-RCL]